MENVYKKIVCKLCGSQEFEQVLDLGVMPLANAFLPKSSLGKPEPAFPLAVNFCNTCFSLQLDHVVSGEVLFKDYHYETSASRPLAEHFYELADEIFKGYIRSPHELVVEIGSNDGCLLSRIKDRCRVLGVDPAGNVASSAIKKGIPTLVDFFTKESVKKIKSELGEAKVVVANNVMAHIDDLRAVFSAVKDLLSKDGQFIFEVHWVGNLMTEGGFDQIYHEHLYYHSLHSIKTLVDSLHMVVNDVKLVPIHGESMRVCVGKQGNSSSAVGALLKREIDMGLTKKSTHLNFSKKIESNKKKLRELLSTLKKEGKQVVGYGAPAKGNTLLNYFGISTDMLDFITDTTPSKQGTYTPGTHIPVVSPEILKTKTPDYILLLSWNYAKAILEKEKELRAKGAKFILPVPEIIVL